MKLKTLTLVIAATGASAALVLGSAGAALAGTSPNSSPQSSSPGHFSYSDFAGPQKCNEVHHPGSGAVPPVPGATTLAGYDTITCVFATPDTALAGQTFNGLGWSSDFGGHPNGLINLTIAADGSGYHGVAWYPSG